MKIEITRVGKHDVALEIVFQTKSLITNSLFDTPENLRVVNAILNDAANMLVLLAEAYAEPDDGD
jgi:hypothetical protein